MTYVSGIKVGIAVSFIVTFLTILGKIGKHALCESFKPEE